LNTDPNKRFKVDEIRNHVWFKIIKEIKIDGVIEGFNKLNIDIESLNSLNEFGFNLEYAKVCLDQNKHNHLTATY